MLQKAPENTIKLLRGQLPWGQIVKLTTTCPASLKTAGLERAHALHVEIYQESADVLTLILYLLAAFMATDREFENR